jgi:hypothetical protein
MLDLSYHCVGFYLFVVGRNVYPDLHAFPLKGKLG